MNNENKLRASWIQFGKGTYIGFDANNGEIGFGTREITFGKSIDIRQGMMRHGEQLHGVGREYKNKNRTEYYAGEWVHGKREGNGTEVAASHSYTGQWLADKRNGYGRLAYTSGHIYTGYFQNNRYNGQGKMEYPLDRFFEGEWRKNQKWTGVMTDKKKDCTTDWENGKEAKNTC